MQMFIKAIPVFMFSVLSLIVTMALISQYNVHPDEKSHLAVAKYYAEHSLPPEICSEKAAFTYSIYGYSYIDEYDIIYFLSGKLSKINNFLASSEYNEAYPFRMFNLFLFFLLFLLVIKYYQEYYLYFLPLLMTPQTWYLFSYFNADAFGFFVSYLLILYLLNNKNFLSDEQDHRILPLVICALAISLIIFSKKTFWVVNLLFIGFCLCSFFQLKHNKKKFIKKLLIIFSLFFLLVGTRIGYDVALNGMDSAEKRVQCADQRALHQFKPSTDLSEKYFGINLRDRGITLSDMLLDRQWDVSSFNSFFGGYGYMTIFADDNYYFAVKLLLLVFLFTLFLASIKAKGHYLQLLFLFSLIGITLAQSLYHSWVNDFQAQGRYLLAILPFLGVILHLLKASQQHKTILSIMLLFFLFSIYSFSVIALTEIPKNFEAFL